MPGGASLASLTQNLQPGISQLKVRRILHVSLLIGFLGTPKDFADMYQGISDSLTFFRLVGGSSGLSESEPEGPLADFACSEI